MNCSRGTYLHAIVAGQMCGKYAVNAVRPTLEQLGQHIVAVFGALDLLLEGCTVLAECIERS